MWLFVLFCPLISTKVLSYTDTAYCISVPHPMYPGDGQVHVYASRPPPETSAAAISHSPGTAVYSSPSMHASTPHPTTVSSGTVLSPDQAISQMSSTGPRMTAPQEPQQSTSLDVLIGDNL